jgi:hypothetical protein
MNKNAMSHKSARQKMLDLTFIKKSLVLIGQKSFKTLDDPLIAVLKLHRKVSEILDAKKSGLKISEIKLPDTGKPIGVPVAMSDFLLHFIYFTQSQGYNIVSVSEDFSKFDLFRKHYLPHSLPEFLVYLHVYVSEYFVLARNEQRKLDEKKIRYVPEYDWVTRGLIENGKFDSHMPSVVYLAIQLFCEKKKIPLEEGMHLILQYYMKRAGIYRDGN